MAKIPLSCIVPYIGMRVVSHIGTAGVVTDIRPSCERDVRIFTSYDIPLGQLIITITWDNDKKSVSVFPQSLLDKVKVYE